MTTNYRIVHFVPDPFSGARIPVAALVETNEGVRVAHARHVPGPECLGDPLATLMIQDLQQSLREAPRMDRLPVSVETCAVFASQRALPSGIEDPVRWVEEHILPRGMMGAKVATAQLPHRSTEGFQFFERYKVGRYVKRTFKPAVDGHRWFTQTAIGLPEVSHWLDGADDLLLMEPLLPARRDFENDLKKIGQRLLAYRGALKKEGMARLLVYVMPGGKTTDRERALFSLQGIVDQAIDTTNELQAEMFAGEIRRLAMVDHPALYQ